MIHKPKLSDNSNAIGAVMLKFTTYSIVRVNMGDLQRITCFLRFAIMIGRSRMQFEKED